MATILKTAPAGTSRGHWYESPWQIAGRAIGSALAIIAIAALLSMLVVPRLLGGDSLTVLSGSMEPTFAPGDVVVVRGIDEAKVCSDVTVGSIVTFFPEPNDPTLITHRVVGKTIGTFEDGSSCRLITQGDANSSADAPVSPAQVRGLFMFGVPGIGWARQWVAQNAMLAAVALAAVVAGWWIVSGLRKPRTTVVTVPRSQGVAPPAAGRGGAVAAAAAPVEPQEAAREHELRERELALREREIELRERELAALLSQRAGEPTQTEISPPTHRNEA